MIYGWKSGARVKGDPQAVGERLEVLRTKHRGNLSAEAVLDDAHAATSPLHQCFEWDDSKAAHAHRLWQARTIIASITVSLPERPETETRAFVNVSLPDGDDEESGGSTAYVGIKDVLDDPRMRANMIERALAEHETFERKYQQLSELASIFSAANTVRKRLRKVVSIERAGRRRRKQTRERKAARRAER